MASDWFEHKKPVAKITAIQKMIEYMNDNYEMLSANSQKSKEAWGHLLNLSIDGCLTEEEYYAIQKMVGL